MCAKARLGIATATIVMVEEGVVYGAVETEKVFVHETGELKAVSKKDVAHRFVPTNG